MKGLKNIVVGFLVSFVGSIPLGYLNIIGYEIYQKNNLQALFLYLLGVIIVEGFIIYATLLFAEKLSKNKKLLKFIEIFSIVFMFILAGVFFMSGSQPDLGYKNILDDYEPILLGLFFSGLNFFQIPFWLGWNLYLINNQYIVVHSKIKWLYILGTITGTFAGMLCFVMVLNYLSGVNGFISANNLGLIIPIIFFAMGCFQTVKYFRKAKSL